MSLRAEENASCPRRAVKSSTRATTHGVCGMPMPPLGSATRMCSSISTTRPRSTAATVGFARFSSASSTAGSGSSSSSTGSSSAATKSSGSATFRGRGHGSGIEVEHFIGHLWTVDAGLLIRIQIFHDRDRALAADRGRIRGVDRRRDRGSDRAQMTGSGAPSWTEGPGRSFQTSETGEHHEERRQPPVDNARAPRRARSRR